MILYRFCVFCRCLLLRCCLFPALSVLFAVVFTASNSKLLIRISKYVEFCCGGCCLLFVACSLFVVRRLLIFGSCLLFVVCGRLLSAV